MTAPLASTRPQDDADDWAPHGMVVVAMMALGSVLLTLSFLDFTWFAVPMPEGGQALIPFSALDGMSTHGAAIGVRAQFEPLAWTCAVLALLGAGAGYRRDRFGAVVAAIGAVAAGAGLALLDYLLRSDGARGDTTWRYAERGLGFAIAGLIVLGVTALVSTRFCVVNGRLVRRGTFAVTTRVHR